MASAKRLGSPHEMTTVVNLGRRSSAPLHKKNPVISQGLLLCSSCFRLRAFDLPSAWQSVQPSAWLFDKILFSPNDK
jgi:hypothetical protein